MSDYPAGCTQDDDVIYIKLTRGYTAVIDREDEALARFRWFAMVGINKNGSKKVYAVRNRRKGETGKNTKFLHCVIFGETSGEVDHIDGNTLNDRRGNLRAATRPQNSVNSGKKKQGMSRFRGVFFHRQRGKWAAQAGSKHIGLFIREENAATAYNFAAHEIYGEFVRGNLP